MKKLRNILSSVCVTSLLIAIPSLSSAAANIVLNNVDPAGVGFNDPTPAAPVGGNVGITVGEQRLIAYQYALDLWGSRLNSVPTIVVRGSFAGLRCDANSGTLASAGALQVFSDFPNVELPGVWYGAALANAIAGVDLFAEMTDGVEPGEPDTFPPTGPPNDEIVARFNGDVGKPGCLENSFWYYGLDNNPPPGGTDFLNTFMHEVGHGLGFQNFANVSTGSLLIGMPDIYTTLSLDTTVGLTHAEMTDEQRVVSFVNSGNVVWIGDNVTAEAPNVLNDRQFLEVTAPESIAGEVNFGFAGFGETPGPGNFNGEVALVADEGGTGTVSDGCEPLVNSGEVSGKIALVDRGACAFTQKTLNAQNAGAIGVMIANNIDGGGAIGLGGSNPAVSIPAIGISKEDGASFKAELENGVFIKISVDPTQLAGADTLNRVQLNAPNPVQPGSSISHFDPAAVPNLLMEPAITVSLKASTDVDLTDDLFADIGWSVNDEPDLPEFGADCNVLEPNDIVFIDGCFTSISDRPVAGVCRLSDVLKKQIDRCADVNDTFVDGFNCARNTFDAMKDLGLMTRIEGYIVSGCAAGSISRRMNSRRP